VPIKVKKVNIGTNNNLKMASIGPNYWDEKTVERIIGEIGEINIGMSTVTCYQQPLQR
jgi:CTP:phosphocholine cytidylyltransferase-like protein